MKRKLFRITTIAAAALLTGGIAFAQQQPMGGPPAGQTQSPNGGMNNAQQMGQMEQQEPSMQRMQDREFVRDALQGGMAEVKLGQLAAQKGSSADVRQLGQTMANDHTQLNNVMQQVATNMQVREPNKMSKKDEKLYAKLSGLSGAEFDHAYIKAMLKCHKDDLESFRREASNSQNPAVQQAASEGAQLTAKNLEVIKSIAKNDGVKS